MSQCSHNKGIRDSSITMKLIESNHCGISKQRNVQVTTIKSPAPERGMLIFYIICREESAVSASDVPAFGKGRNAWQSA